MKTTLLVLIISLVFSKGEHLFQSLEKSFREKSGGLHCIAIFWREHIDEEYLRLNLISLNTSWFLTPIESPDDQTKIEHVCTCYIYNLAPVFLRIINVKNFSLIELHIL